MLLLRLSGICFKVKLNTDGVFINLSFHPSVVWEIYTWRIWLFNFSAVSSRIRFLRFSQKLPSEARVFRVSTSWSCRILSQSLGSSFLSSKPLDWIHILSSLLEKSDLLAQMSSLVFMSSTQHFTTWLTHWRTTGEILRQIRQPVSSTLSYSTFLLHFRRLTI